MRAKESLNELKSSHFTAANVELSSRLYLINPRIRRRPRRPGISPSKVMRSGGDARETQGTRDDRSFLRPKRQSLRHRIPFASRLNFTRGGGGCIAHLIIFIVIIHDQDEICVSLVTQKMITLSNLFRSPMFLFTDSYS